MLVSNDSLQKVSNASVLKEVFPMFVERLEKTIEEEQI